MAAQGRATRHSRKAPPWVTDHHRKIALKGQSIRNSDRIIQLCFAFQGEIYRLMA